MMDFDTRSGGCRHRGNPAWICAFGIKFQLLLKEWFKKNVTNLSNNQFMHIIYLNHQFVSFCCDISKLLVGSNHLLKNWSVSRFWFPGQMGLPMLSGSFCKPLSTFINLHIHPLTDILVLTPCLALICSRSFCQQGCGRKFSQWCIIDRDASTHKDLPQTGV